MILFRADLRKDRNTYARVRNCKIEALSRAFWHILWCHSQHLAPIQFRCASATGTCARARSQRTRSHAFAFHARDPIRTTTVKACRCQHVCQRNERNPSTCEIGRATPRPRPESRPETSPESSPDRGRDEYEASPVKSIKRRLRNDVI